MTEKDETETETETETAARCDYEPTNSIVLLSIDGVMFLVSFLRRQKMGKENHSYCLSILRKTQNGESIEHDQDEGKERGKRPCCCYCYCYYNYCCFFYCFCSCSCFPVVFGC